MHSHRLALSSSLLIQPTAPPFSNFDYVGSHFGGVASIRRLFSQARSYGCRTLVTEEITAKGIAAEDDQELAALFPDFSAGGLRRLSFWRREFRAVDALAALTLQVPPRLRDPET